MTIKPNQDSTKMPASVGPPIYVIQSQDQDSRIDLLALVRIIWAGKWLVLGVTALFVVTGFAYTIYAKPIYRSEGVLVANKPDQGPNISSTLGSLTSLAGISFTPAAGATDALATLRSRVFVEDFILEHDLLSVLFADDWDAANKRWSGDDPEDWPDIRDGVRYFMDTILTIEEDASTGLVTVAVEWTDPELVAQWIEDMVLQINEQLRARDLATSERRLNYLNEQLAQANLVELRQAISRLIESEVQTMTLARAEIEYAFKVIDPPRVPNEVVAPKRLSVLILAFLLGGVIGTSIVLLRGTIADGHPGTSSGEKV
jgi:uncharacterized protein involved in exopolysaccharide biosynthesis